MTALMVALFFACVIMFILASSDIPAGWQDKKGFHYGNDNEEEGEEYW